MSNDDKNVTSLDQKRIEAFWGKPISTYTRAQALADGVLCDLTPIAGAYGFKIPMAATSAVWHTLEWNEATEARKNDSTGQSTEGRLHDVLSLAGLAAQNSARNDPTHLVEFKAAGATRRQCGARPGRNLCAGSVGWRRRRACPDPDVARRGLYRVLSSPSSIRPP